MAFGIRGLPLLALLTLGSCGGSTSPAASPGMASVEEAHQRIAGTWRLVSFQPEKPFGPPFDQLVAQHVGQMRVNFGEGVLTTTGGFEVTRHYEIVSAGVNTAKATVSDDMGVKYDFDLTFEGQQVAFVSQTSPWRGRGLLGRETP